MRQDAGGSLVLSGVVPSDVAATRTTAEFSVIDSTATDCTVAFVLTFDY